MILLWKFVLVVVVVGMVVVVVIGMVVTVVLWNVAAKVRRVVQDVALVVGVACVAATVNVDVVVVFFR